MRPARKMRAGRGTIREVGFRGQVGTCQSAIQTPPLEVPVTTHSLLLCKPSPRGKGMSRCPQKKKSGQDGPRRNRKAGCSMVSH